jgi:hypothetical protein
MAISLIMYMAFVFHHSFVSINIIAIYYNIAESIYPQCSLMCLILVMQIIKYPLPRMVGANINGFDGGYGCWCVSRAGRAMVVLVDTFVHFVQQTQRLPESDDPNMPNERSEVRTTISLTLFPNNRLNMFHHLLIPIPTQRNLPNYRRSCARIKPV